MDYKNLITTSSSTEDSFYAISKNIDKWWGKIDNTVSKVNDEFSIFFGNTEWRFKIKEYVPFKKITWLCVKATHIHKNLTDIETEWLNSELHW